MVYKLKKLKEMFRLTKLEKFYIGTLILLLVSTFIVGFGTNHKDIGISLLLFSFMFFIGVPCYMEQIDGKETENTQ
jgi:hypothetical protein